METTARDRNIDRLRDPTYLPSFNEFVRVYSEYLRKKYKYRPPVECKDTDSRDQAEYKRYIHNHGKGYDDCMSYPGHPGTPLWELAYKTGNYDILTQEYVSAWADYLVIRSQQLVEKTGGGPLRVLEVGAGTGRQKHFIINDIQTRRPDSLGSIQYISTDIWDRASDDPDYRHPFPVDDFVDYKEALQLYEPHIVICGRMPFASDWSVDFRAQPSVQEYILTGGVDTGSMDMWCDNSGLRETIDDFKVGELSEIQRWAIPVGIDLYPMPGQEGKQMPMLTFEEEQYTTAVSFRRIDPNLL